MPRIGLIGGSGLDRWGNDARRETVTTPYGEPSAALQTFVVGDGALVFLPRHGDDHDIAPHRINYRANIHALVEAGVDAILAVNAVGSLDRNLAPGSLVLPDQLIDYTWGRAQSFLDGDLEALDHVEFAEPFSGHWRALLLRAAQSLGVALRDGGCVAVTQGPRLETAAEVRKLARDGCDLVGMTTMPEAALARERGVPYVTLAAVANLGAGLEETPITMEAIEAALAQALAAVPPLVQALLREAS